MAGGPVRGSPVDLYVGSRKQAGRFVVDPYERQDKLIGVMEMFMKMRIVERVKFFARMSLGMLTYFLVMLLILGMFLF